MDILSSYKKFSRFQNLAVFSITPSLSSTLLLHFITSILSFSSTPALNSLICGTVAAREGHREKAHLNRQYIAQFRM